MITLYLYLLATVGTGSGLENGLARYDLIFLYNPLALVILKKNIFY